MIVLNPMGGSNQRVISANGLLDYDVNYLFASYLGKYLTLRGEQVVFTRSTSEARTEIAYNRLIADASPDIILHIRCLEDVSPDPRGFLVECDKYTALSGTITSELYKWNNKSVYPIGYKEVPRSIKARLTEITIGLGYLTNALDADLLKSNESLENLALCIVDAAYGPPTKSIQPKDDIYVQDPYMYRTLCWQEELSTKVSTDRGSLETVTIENIPCRVLRLVTTDAAHATPYLWSTPVTITDFSKEYTLIVSARTKQRNCRGYVAVGSKNTTYTFLDEAWHRITVDYVDGDKVFLGAYGNATIEFTAVWLTPKGTLGSIDDPNKQYSIFPPGYRPVTFIDPTSVDRKLVQSVVTQANSLIGRAQDTSKPSVNSGIGDILSKIDQLPISTKAFVSGVQGINGQFCSLDLRKINVLDPQEMLSKIDYAGIENMVKYVGRMDKKSALQKAINDMKGVEQAAQQLVKTYDQRLELAKKRAEVIQKRMASKGEAMGRP